MHSGQIATVFTMAPSFSPEKKYRRRESAENPFTVLAAKFFVCVIYGLHDGVRAVRGRVGQYPAKSDNPAAVLYHAVGFVQRSNLVAHVHGQFQPVPVVHYADWLFRLREWRLPVHERPSYAAESRTDYSGHDADQYDYRETLTDEFIFVKKLRTGELAAVLIIPENFAKKFYTQQPIDLAFMQDGANILQAGYAASPMQQAVGVFSVQFATNTATFAVSNFREREDLRQPDAKLSGAFL